MTQLLFCTDLFGVFEKCFPCFGQLLSNSKPILDLEGIFLFYLVLFWFLGTQLYVSTHYQIVGGAKQNSSHSRGVPNHQQECQTYAKNSIDNRSTIGANVLLMKHALWVSNSDIWIVTWLPSFFGELSAIIWVHFNYGAYTLWALVWGKFQLSAKFQINSPLMNASCKEVWKWESWFCHA